MKRALNAIAGVLSVLLLLGVVLLQQRASTAAAQAGDKHFPETGKTVPAKFYQYWLSHGGLAQQGYPITDAKMERNSVDGKEYLTQYFERARFELHPENAGTPNEVLLGLLGVEVLKCRPETSGGASSKDAAGTSDFKFLARPANSYIKEWCVEAPCPHGVLAFGGDAPVTDFTQSVTYHMSDESAFNVDGLLRFYNDSLTKAGWKLGNAISVPNSTQEKGQVYLPPANLQGQIQKAAVYFWSDQGRGVISAATIAVVRKNSIGDPPDLSLFQGR